MPAKFIVANAALSMLTELVDVDAGYALPGQLLLNRLPNKCVLRHIAPFAWYSSEAQHDGNGKGNTVPKWQVGLVANLRLRVRETQRRGGWR